MPASTSMADAVSAPAVQKIAASLAVAVAVGILLLVPRMRALRMSRIMESLLVHIEQRYPDAFGGVVDMSAFREIPVLLKRFMDRAWWPFLSFKSKKISNEAP